VHVADPSAPQSALPQWRDIAWRMQTPLASLTGDRAQRLGYALPDSGSPVAPVTDRRPGDFESAAWITRTALCAQVRHGVMYLFMPPL
ncbi:hypothetical protein, partial [Pseudomonas aeruginosa]